MEKVNFVQNGVLRLPPGFRFHPTDEELVVQYLKRKVQSCPLPASIIPEVDVCKADPWELPGDLEEERYFFSRKEMKSRWKRASGSGYWKGSGVEKQVRTSKQVVVGFKKTLIFYRGKPPHGFRTHWLMHEYRLLHPHHNFPHENWVLCRIFSKKKSGKSEDQMTESSRNCASPRKTGLIYYDFMTKDTRSTHLNLAPVSSSSAGSSGITEISCKDSDDDDHEQSSSSCCDSFSPFKRKPLA